MIHYNLNNSRHQKEFSFVEADINVQERMEISKSGSLASLCDPLLVSSSPALMCQVRGCPISVVEFLW